MRLKICHGDLDQFPCPYIPSASKPTKFYRATKFVPTDNFCFDRQFFPGNNFCSDRQFLFRPTIFVPTDKFCSDRQILFRPTIFVGRYKFWCLCKNAKIRAFRCVRTCAYAHVRAHVRAYMRAVFAMSAFQRANTIRIRFQRQVI